MSSLDNVNTSSKGNSTQTFLAALVLNAGVAAIEILGFIIIKNRFKKIYSPRSYLVAPRKQVPFLPRSLFGWIPTIIKADAKQIIAKNGLDAYIFVRFLFLMMEIFLPFTILTWIVLIPVDLANSGGTNTGIERLTFGNIGLSQQPRYAAHLVVVWILTFWVFYLLKREISMFIILRQDFLISKQHAQQAQAKTVLVTGVAKEYCNVESITKLCSVLPGGVKRVWIARSLGNLPDNFDRRQAAYSKLESAETTILKKIAKLLNKKGGPATPTPDEIERDPTLLNTLMSKDNRPKHRLGFMGLWGKKVDSIDWSLEEIKTTGNFISTARATLEGEDASARDKDYAAESAAFIQFNTQIAAHMFAQCLTHHSPLRMQSRYLEVDQEDVVWSNLSISPLQARGRYLISWGLTLGLIIFWAIPVAFVGVISSLSYLCSTVKWLAWICKLPAPIPGILTGALPPILLAVLFMLLPIVLRLFARFEGIPLKSHIELSLMSRYFLFLVIHGFLIVTLSSGIMAAIPQLLKSPGSIVNILATKLPAASTFFLTYILTTALGGAAGGLLQIVPLIIYYVKLFVLGSTPRAIFGIRYNMGNVAWGTLFPNMTLLMVIGISYSVIAPLVTAIALGGFALFWFVYKYLFLYVYDMPSNGETGGLFYPKAIGHIFVALYVEEICMAGLFFLATDQDKKQSALPEGIMMIALIIITAAVQIVFNAGFQPLVAFLPLSMGGRIAEVLGDMAALELHGLSGGSPTDKGTPETLHEEGVFPPRSRSSNDDGKLLDRRNSGRATTPDGEEVLDIHAFDHPSTYVNPKPIWMPADDYGFYRGEVETIRGDHIEVSTDGAVMHKNGKIEISRSPPGDEWSDKQTL